MKSKISHLVDSFQFSDGDITELKGTTTSILIHELIVSGLLFHLHCTVFNGSFIFFHFHIRLKK